MDGPEVPEVKPELGCLTGHWGWGAHTLSREMWEIWKRRMMTQMSPRMKAWSLSTMFSGPMRGIGTCGHSWPGSAQSLCAGEDPERAPVQGAATHWEGPGACPAPQGLQGRGRQGARPGEQRLSDWLGLWPQPGELGWTARGVCSQYEGCRCTWVKVIGSAMELEMRGHNTQCLGSIDSSCLPPSSEASRSLQGGLGALAHTRLSEFRSLLEIQIPNLHQSHSLGPGCRNLHLDNPPGASH